MKTSNSTFEKFDAALRKVLAVPHAELAKREQEWKESRKKREKQKKSKK